MGGFHNVTLQGVMSRNRSPIVGCRNQTMILSAASWFLREFQISALKLDQNDQESRYLLEIEELRSRADAENRKLRDDMYASAEEYSRKIASMEEIQREELRTLLAQKQREIEVSGVGGIRAVWIRLLLREQGLNTVGQS